MSASMLRTVFAVCVVWAAVAPAGVGATPEDLDPTFGTGGVVAIAEPDTVAGPMRVLPEDGILLVVEGTDSPKRGLWKFDPAGLPDASFGGGDGFVAVTEFCSESKCRIVDIAASKSAVHVLLSSLQVAGLRADGALDRRFGTDGYAGAPSQVREVRSLGLDGLGRLVILAHADAGGLAYRLRPDGTLDASYGSDPGHPGVVSLGSGEVGPAIVDADGTVVWLTYGNGERIRRLLSDGRVDAAFMPMWPSDMHGSAMLRDRAGRIIVGGAERLAYPRYRPVVLAFDATGTPDTGFGSAGVARIATDVPGEDGSVAAMTVDSVGRIVVTGGVGRRGYTPLEAWIPRMLIARLLPDGSPDTHFAPAGAAALRMGIGTDGRDVEVQTSGRIVVAGGVLEEIRYVSKYQDTRYRAVLFALTGGSTVYDRPYAESVAIEYFHRGYGHYFASAGVGETRRLDTDPDWKAQWSRTGYAFNVWSVPEAERLPVCRFWSGQSFAPKSSHFYTPYAGECAKVKADPVWQFEGNAFALRLPEAGLGFVTCPSDTRPLYRAYNRGMSGAPNHRYTTDRAVLDEMIAQGWTMEGDASTQVFACVPRHD